MQRKEIPMSEATPLVTAEELQRMGSDFRYELVEGRLVPMSPIAPLHGTVVAAFIALLRPHVKKHGLGALGPEIGFTLTRNPDTVLAPDVGFIRRERIPTTGFAPGFWQGPPDLAVEVLSPDDRASQIRTKVDKYLKAGVLAVVVVDPREQKVSVHRRLAAPVTCSVDDTLDLDDVVPGFTCPVQEIFD